LKAIEDAGIPRQGAVLMAVMAAMRRLDCFHPEIKDHFRDRKYEAQRVSKRLKALAKDARNLPGLSYLLDGEARRLMNCGKNLGDHLRKHGREDHDQAIPIIVSSILAYRPHFQEWKALANIINSAYCAAGRDTNADYEKLLRRARSNPLQFPA
jgi:hypothetical protein